jgi:type I restriction enzyme S subunit
VRWESKSSVVPRLRFPEFRGAPVWTEARLDDLITVIAPPAKLQSTSYLSSGKFPIVDQSQQAISGWTDDDAAVVMEPVPLIVFGDHTCALKLLQQPFAQGADGIKILKAKAVVSAEYLFQSLSNRPLVMEDYKRHFSMLKERLVPYPDVKTGEQQKIASCLLSIDEIITAQARKLEALKTYKRGLVQQLFPREGEALPRFRFASVSSWHSQKISSLLSKAANAVNVEPEATYREIGIRSHGKGIFHKEPVRGKAIGEKRVFHVVQDALILNIVFAWEQAVATTSRSEVGMIASHRFPMYVAKPGKCDIHYVKEFFLTRIGKHLLGLASPGGAGRNKTLGQKEFENLEIALPVSIDEQTRIANCLSSLDSDIAAESEKLDTLKVHKKGLTQQLFPLPDGA